MQERRQGKLKTAPATVVAASRVVRKMSRAVREVGKEYRSCQGFGKNISDNSEPAGADDYNC